MLLPSLNHSYIKKAKSINNIINKNSFSNKKIKNDSFINISKITNNSSSSFNNINENKILKNGNNQIKKIYHESSKRHPKCSSCTHKYENILFKNKSALSNFIINNAPSKKNYYFPNIKLLGNARYKYSPFLFVEDQKNNNMPEENFGLIPIPLEKFRKKTRKDKDEEEKNLYELQRSIVMSRRFQYNNDQFKKGKNIYYDDLYKIYMNNTDENDFINKVILIQRWWKKYFHLYKIEKLEKSLNKVLIHRVFKKLKKYLLIKKFFIKICYITKKKYKFNYNELIKKIQRFYRKYNIIKKDINKHSYISKLFFNNSFIYYLEAIEKIQKNYRIYRNKNLIKNLNNNKNTKDNNNKEFINNKKKENEENEFFDDIYPNSKGNNKTNNSNNILENNDKKYNNSKDNISKKNNNITNEKINDNLINNQKNNSILNNKENIKKEKDEIDYNLSDNQNDNNTKNNNIINSKQWSIKLPINNICYLNKDKKIILIDKYNNNNLYDNSKKIIYNQIENMHIEINNKDDFIDKIYKKPIINGKHFKYQYYFSNNPFSYTNVCYISKIVINEKILLSFNIDGINQNKIKDNKSKNGFKINSKRPSKQSKNQGNKEPIILSKRGNQDNDISLEKSGANSKRNSRLSLSHLSDRKKTSLKNSNDTNNEINFENKPIKIKKTFKNGYFISKEIFKQPKKNIIKIQRCIHETISKNPVFKRPSHSYPQYKILSNLDNDSNLFDTDVQAKIIINKDRKKSANYIGLNFPNSPIKEKKETKSENQSVKNNINPINIETKNNNLEENESESDSAIITKIKLNDESNEDKSNFKENNNYIFKQIDYSSKDIFYISKIRRINFIKDIQTIQKLYRIYSNPKNSHKSSIKIKTFKKPKNKCCFLKIKRFAKPSTDRNIFIYNPNMKYFIFLLKLFITKNVQEFIFKIIKNKSKISNRSYFCFPFYIRTIQRISNFLNKRNNYNQKIFLFFNEIFNYNGGDRYKFILKKLCFLSKNEKNKLLYSNLFTGYEENELISFLCNFSEFDKNLNNEEFITERLKQTKLNDTNIFTLVKLIDDEYEKLVKGLYCLKCFNDINICRCFLNNRNINEKEIKQNEISDDEENIDDLDFTDRELNDEDYNDRKINYFYYSTNNDNKENILIKTKSKIDQSNKLIFKQIISNEEL